MKTVDKMRKTTNTQTTSPSTLGAFGRRVRAVLAVDEDLSEFVQMQEWAKTESGYEWRNLAGHSDLPAVMLATLMQKADG
mgnify:CR=1 FL=1